MKSATGGKAPGSTGEADEGVDRTFHPEHERAANKREVLSMLDMLTGALQTLTVAKAAVDGAIVLHRKITYLAKASQSIELRETMIELREQLIVVKDTNLTLIEKLQELERERQLGQEMMFEDPVYWKVSGGLKEGPYCAVCWDGSSKVIPLHSNPYKNNPRWQCRVCDNDFESKEARDAKSADWRAPILE